MRRGALSGGFAHGVRAVAAPLAAAHAGLLLVRGVGLWLRRLLSRRPRVGGRRLRARGLFFVLGQVNGWRGDCRPPGPFGASAAARIRRRGRGPSPRHALVKAFDPRSLAQSRAEVAVHVIVLRSERRSERESEGAAQQPQPQPSSGAGAQARGHTRTCSPRRCQRRRVRGKSWKQAQQRSHSATRRPAQRSTPGGVVAVPRLKTCAAGTAHSTQHWLMNSARQHCHPRRRVPTCCIPCRAHAACQSIARCCSSTRRQAAHAVAQRDSSAPPTPARVRMRTSSSGGSACQPAGGPSVVVEALGAPLAAAMVSP